MTEKKSYFNILSTVYQKLGILDMKHWTLINENIQQELGDATSES